MEPTWDLLLAVEIAGCIVWAKGDLWDPLVQDFLTVLLVILSYRDSHVGCWSPSLGFSPWGGKSTTHLSGQWNWFLTFPNILSKDLLRTTDLSSLSYSHQGCRNRSLEKKRKASFPDHATHETLIYLHLASLRYPGVLGAEESLSLCLYVSVSVSPFFYDPLRPWERRHFITQTPQIGGYVRHLCGGWKRTGLVYYISWAWFMRCFSKSPLCIVHHLCGIFCEKPRIHYFMITLYPQASLFSLLPLWWAWGMYFSSFLVWSPTLFLFFIVYFSDLCTLFYVHEFFACMYVCMVPHTCLVPKDVRKEHESPGAGTRDGFESPCMFWKWNPDPLKEQHVLLIPELSLLSLCSYLFKSIYLHVYIYMFIQYFCVYMFMCEVSTHHGI